MAINLNLDEELNNIDISNIKIRGKRGKAKKDTLIDSSENAVIDAINRVSNFKSIRHLVEFAIVKESLIRFDQVERMIRREFPGQVFDAASFMWIKLDYAKNKHLEFGELILEQLKKEKENTK